MNINSSLTPPTGVPANGDSYPTSGTMQVGSTIFWLEPIKSFGPVQILFFGIAVLRIGYYCIKFRQERMNLHDLEMEIVKTFYVVQHQWVQALSLSQVIART